MPKSKRAKQVSLTKVKKTTGTPKKNDLLVKIRDATEKYARVMVLEVHQQRNQFMQRFRKHFAKSATIFMGKNKLMQGAFGLSPETECQENIHKLSEKLTGVVCVMCTNETVANVQRFCKANTPTAFARAGNVAGMTVQLERDGKDLERFSGSIEAHLRSLGMPTLLKDGKIMLLGDYTVCEEGKELTVDQAQILKLLGIQMSQFELTPTAVWEKKDGNFLEL